MLNVRSNAYNHVWRCSFFVVDNDLRRLMRRVETGVFFTQSADRRELESLSEEGEAISGQVEVEVEAVAARLVNEIAKQFDLRSMDSRNIAKQERAFERTNLTASVLAEASARAISAI